MQSCTHGLTLRQPGPKNTRRAVRIAHTTPYAERPPVEHRVGGNLREPRPLWYCTFESFLESFMSFSSSVRTNSSNTSIDPMKNSRPLPPGLDPRPGQLWVKSHHHQQVSHLGANSRRDATHTLPAVCRAPQLRLALLAPLAPILGLGGG